MSLLLGAGLIISLYGYFRHELYRFLSLKRKPRLWKTLAARWISWCAICKMPALGAPGARRWKPARPTTRSAMRDTVCNRVYSATPVIFHVQMDLNGNGNCADNDPRENLRYEFTGPTATCPGPYIIRRNGDCLVANVVPDSAGKILTYYDADGYDLGAMPAAAAIKRVKIAFAVETKNPDAKIGGSLSSRAFHECGVSQLTVNVMKSSDQSRNNQPTGMVLFTLLDDSLGPPRGRHRCAHDVAKRLQGPDQFT